jgi:hypothetical protein
MNIFNTLKTIAVFSAILTVTSCSKSGSANVNPDLGYGCDTKSVRKVMTSTPGKLVYITGQSNWGVFFTYSGSTEIGCSICNTNDPGFKAIIAGHSITDAIDVVFSGTVKDFSQNQGEPVYHTGYKDMYLITLSAVN